MWSSLKSSLVNCIIVCGLSLSLVGCGDSSDDESVIEIDTTTTDSSASDSSDCSSSESSSDSDSSASSNCESSSTVQLDQLVCAVQLNTAYLSGKSYSDVLVGPDNGNTL